MESWIARSRALAELDTRQLFFIGGAPRSGTTWLQQLLDAHPAVSCRGEGLFLNQLAAPLERLMRERAAALADKNTRLFGHTGGYPLPQADDLEFLLGTGVLLSLQRQGAGPECHAIGEKTPENVFLYPRLKRLFPRARFVGIVRDPRDVLTSAWHFFHPAVAPEAEEAAKVAFVHRALPSLDAGLREMAALGERDGAVTVVSYERLSLDPAAELAGVLRGLGVAADAGTCHACVERSAFAAVASRAAALPGSRPFLRKGVVGDWRTTLSPAAEALVMEAVGWAFPVFGWQR